MLLGPQQREQFERDGVACLGPLLSGDQIAALGQRLDRLMYDDGGRPRHGVRDLSELSGAPLTYSVLQLVNGYRRDPALAELVHDQVIVDAVKTLLGPQIRVFRDQTFYKECGPHSEIPLHQDNRYWHIDPPAAVTVWIALDHATVASGCVHYLLGSHRRGRIHHHRAGRGRSILLEADVDRDQTVPMEVAAGSALIHDCQVVHWSPCNRTGKRRRAYTIEYVAAAARHRGAALDDQAYPLI